MHPNPSLDSVLCSHAALHSFMHAKSAEMALLSAVNLGGDADTVGACTGCPCWCILGARCPARCGGGPGWRGAMNWPGSAERVWELRADRPALNGVYANRPLTGHIRKYLARYVMPSPDQNAPFICPTALILTI